MISTDEVYGAGDPAGGCSTRMRRCVRGARTRRARRRPTCSAWRTVATYGVPVDGGARHERLRPPPDRAGGADLRAQRAARAARARVRRGPAAARVPLRRGLGARARCGARSRRARRVYNIGAGTSCQPRARAAHLRARRRPGRLITFVPDRPGHDFRYGVRSDRLRRARGGARGGVRRGARATRSTGTASTSTCSRPAHVGRRS